MKIAILTAAVLALATLDARANEQEDRFFKALAQVEGWPHGNSDKNQAVGPYQIRWAYWKDAKMTNGCWLNCNREPYAREVVKRYFQRHAKKAWEAMDWKTLARIHHCGPKAIQRGKGKAFAQRVLNLMGEKGS